MPRRVLMPIGAVLVLVIAVGWSSMRRPREPVAQDASSLRLLAAVRPDATLPHLQATPERMTAAEPRLTPTFPRASTAEATTRPPDAVPLTDGWKSVPDPHNLGIAEDWGQGGGGDLPWSPVTLPNDYNATVSSTSNTGTVTWYELQFTGPPITQDRSWNVAFESVRRNAQVWLNGYEIGSSSDPYAPFSLPATTLKPEQPNLLIIRVDNIRGGSSLPEDWWNWGGIMGPVTLEPTGRLGLNDLGVTSTVGCGERCGSFVVRGSVVNRWIGALPATLLTRVTAPGGGTITARHSLGRIRSGAGVELNVTVPARRPVALWSPQHPSLYTVQVQVVSGNRVEESQTMTTGLR